LSNFWPAHSATSCSRPPRSWRRRSGALRRECAGQKFDNYVEWLAIAYAITLVCCPALSLPAGFTRENLPVGLQIVGAAAVGRRVLAGAKALEDILGLKGQTPIDPRSDS